MAKPIHCLGCGQRHDPLLRCPTTLTSAQVESAGKALAQAAKKSGIRIAVKPTKMHTTPAAERVAAAHGMTVQELSAKLATFEAEKAKRRVAKAKAQRTWRAKQKGKSK